MDSYIIVYEMIKDKQYLAIHRNATKMANRCALNLKNSICIVL